MDFAQTVSSGFKNYVGFDGRASRSEYWYWTLFSVVASIIAAAMDSVVGLGFFSGAVSLGLLLPSLAVAFRRIHDIDRTAWWILLSFTVIGGIVLLIWFCLRGTMGTNRFGPDPL